MMAWEDGSKMVSCRAYVSCRTRSCDTQLDFRSRLYSKNRPTCSNDRFHSSYKDYHVIFFPKEYKIEQLDLTVPGFTIRTKAFS